MGWGEQQETSGNIIAGYILKSIGIGVDVIHGRLSARKDGYYSWMRMTCMMSSGAVDDDS